MGGVISEKVDEEAKPESAENEENAIFPVTLQTLIFQLVMLFTTLYFGMLFANWGDAVIEGENDGYYGGAMFSVWAKQISLWFTLALFTVSVTMPICCADRIL